MDSKKLYLVSFGNSKVYVVNETREERDKLLNGIENQLNQYLSEKFPDNTFAYFTTPKVTEINPGHAAEYSSYPHLNGAAIDTIKSVLTREVMNMKDLHILNRNAPYDKLNKAAAGLRGLL